MYPLAYERFGGELSCTKLSLAFANSLARGRILLVPFMVD